MKRTEYKQLKRQVEEEYAKAIKAADDKRIESLQAIEKVWRLYHPPKRQSHQSIGEEATKDTNGYGSLVSAVKRALDVVPDTFTKQHIQTAISESGNNSSYNPASIAGCLSRLTRDKVIEIVEKGRGSAPNIYRKCKQEQNDNINNNNQDGQ